MCAANLLNHPRVDNFFSPDVYEIIHIRSIRFKTDVLKYFVWERYRCGVIHSFIHSKKPIYLIYTLRIRKESRSTWFNMMKSWNITVKNGVQTSCIMKKIINSRNKEYRISGTIHISSLIISIIFEQQYQTSANNHARKCSYEICLRKLARNRIPPPRLEQQFERV